MPRHRARHPFLLILTVLAVAACVARPPIAGTPAPSTSPSAMAVTPAPSGPSAGPSATPATQVSLLDMLPNFAGPDLLQKRAITGADVTGAGSSESRFFEQMFAALGRPATAFDGAAATSSHIRMLAMRVDGVDATTLADALIDAMVAERPGGILTKAIVGGREVTRIRWSGDPLGDDVHVMIANDVVFLATAHDDKEPIVLEVLATMFEPKLEDRLPAELGGQPTVRYSLPAVAISEGGDVCSILCPGEPRRFSEQLGIGLDELDLAAAYLEQPPGVLIVAMHVNGADEDQMIEARIKANSSAELNPLFARHTMTVGGKPVTWVNLGPFDSINGRELLYAMDDVLYIVRPAPAADEAPDAVLEEAIAALP